MEGRKMKKFLCLSVALLLALAVSAPAQTAVELIKVGDDARDQRDDAKALESYLAALELEPENYEALWKASGSMVDVADLVNVRAKGGLEKQKKYYQDAAEYARKAIAVNPNDTNGHFQLSAALGMYALGLGNKEKIAMSREIKAEIEKSIELDPNNDGAYHALGRWHRTIAEIGGAKRLLGGILYGKMPKGTNEEALTYLIKAVEIKPDDIHHHLELGRTYVVVEDYKEAAAEFRKCVDLPEASGKDAMYKQEAKAELRKIQNKLK